MTAGSGLADMEECPGTGRMQDKPGAGSRRSLEDKRTERLELSDGWDGLEGGTAPSGAGRRAAGGTYPH